jgi:hypothetical protein
LPNLLDVSDLFAEKTCDEIGTKHKNLEVKKKNVVWWGTRISSSVAVFSANAFKTAVSSFATRAVPETGRTGNSSALFMLAAQLTLRVTLAWCDIGR